MSHELVEGAWDLHVHAAPSLFPRWGDGRDLARACLAARMRGVLLKAHHGSTVEVAHLLRAELPGLEICGGVCLNSFVGGLNPLAVEACLRIGGRAVWLPTIHARHHGQVFGVLGGLAGGDRQAPAEGLSAIDDHGRLVAPLRQILDLLHGRPALLGTGHLSPDEIFALQRHIAGERLSIRLVVNHPFFRIPALTRDQVRSLSNSWTAFELCYNTVSPRWGGAVEQVAGHVVALPGTRWVMASDSGQPDNPPAPAALAAFCDALLACGVPGETLHRMLHDEPAALMAGTEPMG